MVIANYLSLKYNEKKISGLYFQKQCQLQIPYNKFAHPL